MSQKKINKIIKIKSQSKRLIESIPGESNMLSNRQRKRERNDVCKNSEKKSKIKTFFLGNLPTPGENIIFAGVEYD